MAKSDEDLPQLNTHHSPTSTLSPDVLSLIFQHACTLPDLNGRHGFPPAPSAWLSKSPRPGEKKTQFTLSAVSVYWRQVSTLLTPYIWTSVDIIVDPVTVRRASAVLQAFLTYSGQLPIVISLRFDRSWKFDTKVLVDTASDKALSQNTHRIRELYLRGLPDPWIDFLPSLSDLAHLSVQKTSIPRPAPPVMIKSQCSSLALKIRRPRLSCPNLTVLHLYVVDIDFCVELLKTCPNLIEFRNRDPQEGQDEGGTLLTGPLVLPSMEVFEWSINTTYETDLALLRHLRMPSLRELIWSEEDRDTSHPTDPVDVFFQNLPSTLTHLHIHNAVVGLCQPPLISVFDVVHDSLNIECLTLSGVDNAFLDHVFERLTPALEFSGSRRRVKLPNLRAIHIRDISESTELSLDEVLQMLERRFLGAGGFDQEPFRIELPPKVELSSELKEELKEMIGRGLKVEILQGAKLIHLL